MSDIKTCGQCGNCKPCASETHGLCDFVGKIPIWMRVMFDDDWRNSVYTVSLESNFASECDCFYEVRDRAAVPPNKHGKKC